MVGYVAASVSLGSTPRLQSVDDRLVDIRSVHFLNQQLTARKRQEEDGRRELEEAEHEAHMQELNRRVQDGVPLNLAECLVAVDRPPSTPRKRRKRKKRRKKKLPKSSSSSCLVSG